VWERGKTPGFGVRVSKGGTKTFIFVNAGEIMHRGAGAKIHQHG
jgi:hypothetical protein